MTQMIELVDRDIRTVMMVVHMFKKPKERFNMLNGAEDITMTNQTFRDKNYSV